MSSKCCNTLSRINDSSILHDTDASVMYGPSSAAADPAIIDVTISMVRSMATEDAVTAQGSCSS